MTKPIHVFFTMTLCLFFTAMAVTADASAIRPGLFNSFSLAANDDGSTGLVNIGFGSNFFGTTYNQLYVNNNGNVTFESSLSAYTPTGIAGVSYPIIAPFFADVDTRSGNILTYGQSLVDSHNAFGVNWIDVGYFSQHTSPLNSFQLVLIERADSGPGDFDIEFNYDQILWETGDASSGSGGLGGSSAYVGYSNGASDYYEFAGSGVNGAFLDGGPNSLVAGSNIDYAGRYLFTVRNGVVSPIEPTTTPIPEPSTILLLGAGFLGVLALGRKKLSRN